LVVFGLLLGWICPDSGERRGRNRGILVNASAGDAQASAKLAGKT
jgi:hypothetical protein